MDVRTKRARPGAPEFEQRMVPIEKPNKRRLPWVVGGAAIIGVLAAGTFLLPSPPAQVIPQTVTVTYRVSTVSKGGTARTMSYIDKENSSERRSGAKLPFTHEVALPGDKAIPVSIQAEAGAETRQITCQILRGDQLLVSSTATGDYAVASCTAVSK